MLLKFGQIEIEDVILCIFMLILNNEMSKNPFIINLFKYLAILFFQTSFYSVCNRSYESPQ